MAHLRIFKLTDLTGERSPTAWVLAHLHLPRAQVVPRTLDPRPPSLVGLRVFGTQDSFGFECWTVDRTHRFIVHSPKKDSYSALFILYHLERFVDRMARRPDITTLELGGAILALFTQQEQLAPLLGRFPGLTRLSIGSTNEIPVDGGCPVELVEALRGRGKPLEELVFVGEPPFELEVWREKMEAAGVVSVTRAAVDGGSDEEEEEDEYQ
ncbi:uncharacterized protein BXZ73DRAFT_108354 [Epithele typhae]|uniref:uncharacterized protein n=1 Tax=Epithele typhae TaxID=378194 RepID=UPI0020073B63|nr:uncharacterized protein BXZ73DRAFT_108354 [Epithele typhae]KAH9910928.1 hypothetical protein BXZ73DRAFT_108354 [Epithele typhae]